MVIPAVEIAYPVLIIAVTNSTQRISQPGQRTSADIPFLEFLTVTEIINGLASLPAEVLNSVKGVR